MESEVLHDRFRLAPFDCRSNLCVSALLSGPYLKRWKKRGILLPFVSLTKALLFVGKMGDNDATKNPLLNHQVLEVSTDICPDASSKCFDDDRHPKCTGKFY